MLSSGATAARSTTKATNELLNEGTPIEQSLAPQMTCNKHFGQTEIRVKSARQRKNEEISGDEEERSERIFSQRERVKLKSRLASPKITTVIEEKQETTVVSHQFDKEEHECSQVSLNAQVSSPELVEKSHKPEIDDDESRENQPHEHMKLENRVLSPNISTVVEEKQQSALMVPMTPVTRPQWNSSTVVEKVDEVDEMPLWMRGTSPMSRPMSTSKPNSGKGEEGGDFMGSNSSGSETEREEA